MESWTSLWCLAAAVLDRSCRKIAIALTDLPKGEKKGGTEVIIGAPRFKDYNRKMQNTPTFMPREPSFLEIEVKRNDAEDTFETNLHCSRNHCRKIVNIDSDGPKTVQRVSCPKHGFLISFPNRIALGELIRFLANEILAANGHKLIEEGATSIFESDQSLHKDLN